MKEFRFVQAENGGWVVTETGEAGIIPSIRAAFTSTEDLVAGFVGLLEPAPAPEGDIEMGAGEV